MFELFSLILLIAFIYALSYWIYKTYFYHPTIEVEQLKERSVIITGASRGIGEELAYAYSRYGCRLVLAARSIDVLEDRVAKECLKQGATDVRCVKFDASTEESCNELIEKTIESYQRIDILVLNHTMAIYGQFLDTDLTENVQQMKKHFDTNFFAYFYLAIKALPHLAKSGTALRRSQVIALSSLAGSCPFPKTTIYGTTKHAIQGFFTNFARDLNNSDAYKNHVSSTLVTLGLIATDEALRKTSKHLHWASVSVRKTAETILAAGVYGHARIFYPYSLIILPSLYYVFNPLFEIIARLGN